jgi:poly-beta-1,6-N-acetyl-D-glucosamine synthase
MYATLFSFEPLHITLLSLLGVMALIQLIYYFRFYRRVAFRKREKENSDSSLPPLSVIICARNEASNIESFLPSVLEQDYPSFEVLVINDGSEDETEEVLDLMQKKYKHLRVSKIQNDFQFSHSKKLPMLIGIKAAKNDLLVFTDADCKPVSDKWLASVAKGYSSGAEIIIGYGGYLPGKGLLNKYIRYETLFTGMQYLGMAIAGRPYMGVGRNLAYRRTFFFNNGAFGPFNHVQSGDDDLFVNRTATKKNTYALTGSETSTLSIPAKNYEAWIRQKRRHYTTAKYYRFTDKFRLFMEPFSRVSYYGLLIFFLITLISWPVVAGIGLLRLLTRSIIFNRGAETFNERGLFFFSLIFDILQPLVNTTLYITNRRQNRGNKSWK